MPGSFQSLLKEDEAFRQVRGGFGLPSTKEMPLSWSLWKFGMNVACLLS